MFPRPTRLIITQFTPPAGFSLLAAAEMLGESKRAVAAHLVDLAVRGVIAVRPGEHAGSGFTLTLRRMPADDRRQSTHDDLDVLLALFPAGRLGSTVTLDAAGKRRLGAPLARAHRRAVARLVAGQLVRERGLADRLAKFWLKQPTEPTERAYPYIDHLWGVRDYIAWAEADRLQFHQSPQGAALRELDGIAMLHLYERLLPYAVLFGLEKDWMRELGIRYDQVRAEYGDDWLAVEAAIEVGGHVAVLADAIGDLPGVPGFGELPDFGDLQGMVDLGGAMEGIGAFFGGIGEFLGGIDV